MAGEVCGDFYNQTLAQTLTNSALVTYFLRLYTNNHTPILNEVPSNFTEAAVGGYTAIQLVTGNWVITDTAGAVVALYPQQTFNFNAGVSIYGYYITDPGKTKIYWAELFAGGPIAYAAGGGQLLLSLEIDGPTV